MDEKSRQIRAWLANRYDMEEKEKEASEQGECLEVTGEVKFRLGKAALIVVLGGTGFTGIFSMGAYIGNAYYSNEWDHLRVNVECPSNHETQPVRSEQARDEDGKPAECKVGSDGDDE